MKSTVVGGHVKAIISTHSIATLGNRGPQLQLHLVVVARTRKSLRLIILMHGASEPVADLKNGRSKSDRGFCLPIPYR